VTKTKKRPAAGRLDGKKKLVRLTREMEADLRAYCRDKGVESESELIRQAVAKYIYADYRDDTLKLQGIAGVLKLLEEARDMNDVFFRYVRLMHINLLAYLPEIDTALAGAALRSARERHEKLFNSFRNSLKNDPSFFERLLQTFFKEAPDG
jgi:metal-responsive CopG/Arc/MetJ family transcriptional regulator